MVRSFFTVACALSVSLFGCASASGPGDVQSETDEAALSSGFTKVTSCDHGAFVVDVKDYPTAPPAGEDPTYKVQGVIRNEAILQYLESTGALSRNPRKRSEAIVSGQIWLSSFRGPFNGSFHSTTREGVEVDVERYGNGIKVRFTRPGSSSLCPSFCTNLTDPEYSPSSGNCEGCISATGPTEIANWWFSDCPVLADVHR